MHVFECVRERVCVHVCMHVWCVHTVSVIRKFPFRNSFTIVKQSSNDRCGTIVASLQNRT